MRTETYGPEKREQWDAFVLSNPQASVSHLSAAFVLAERTQGARNRSVMLRGNDGSVAAVLPMLEVSHRELRLIIVREMLCGGPLLDPQLSRSDARQALQDLIDVAKTTAARAGADRVTVLYPASAGGCLAIERYGYLPVKEFGFRELNSVGQFLDLDQDENTLFGNLDSKCRNMIRRAQKGGVRALALTDRERWLSCYDLNVQTLGSGAYSRAAMETIWDEFISKGLAVAVAAEVEQRIVGIAVVSCFNRAGYYWLGFNEQPHAAPGSSNYALWEAILHCKRQGVRWFNVGSIEFSSNQKQRNIAAFKAQFGGIPAYTLSGVWERRPGKRWLLDWAADHAAGLRHRLRG